jgi:hypothetical protein
MLYIYIYVCVCEILYLSYSISYIYIIEESVGEMHNIKTSGILKCRQMSIK